MEGTNLQKKEELYNDSFWWKQHSSIKESDCKKYYFKCSPELKEEFGKFNRFFIDTIVAQNLVLNKDESLTLNESLYAYKSVDEKEYIESILKLSVKTVADIKHLEGVYVKEWKAWFIYSEVCDTFVAAVSIAPAAVIGTLQVTRSGFPVVGNVVIAAMGAFGDVYMC